MMGKIRMKQLCVSPRIAQRFGKHFSTLLCNGSQNCKNKTEEFASLACKKLAFVKTEVNTDTLSV